MGERLPEPQTKFQWLLRDLAEAAMSVTHHDCADFEPEYVHEVEAMEQKFRELLRRYRPNKRAAHPQEPRGG